jgi:hypothetical protein
MEECVVGQRSWLKVGFVVSYCVICFSAASAMGQSPTTQTQNDGAAEKTGHAEISDVSGDWQLSWQVRLGTDVGTLHLQQGGKKLTGTFKDLHGLSSLTGTVEGSAISFDVQFQGKYPFTTRFTGKITDAKIGAGKIEGTSQAINVNDGGGAYLGHGGEIVHPEHPWTATRVASQTTPDQSDSNQAGTKPGSGQNSPAKN